MIWRREFIAVLGGAAVARPRAARAQQPGAMRRIGALISFAADVSGSTGPSRRGCSIWAGPTGRNVRIDTRWAAGRGHSQIRGGIGRPRAGGHLGYWQLYFGAIATRDPQRADRVHADCSRHGTDTGRTAQIAGRYFQRPQSFPPRRPNSRSGRRIPARLTARKGSGVRRAVR